MGHLPCRLGRGCGQLRPATAEYRPIDIRPQFLAGHDLAAGQRLALDDGAVLCADLSAALLVLRNGSTRDGHSRRARAAAEPITRAALSMGCSGDVLMATSIEILDYVSQGNLDPARSDDLYTCAMDMDIGQWVKQCRLAAKITQTELGERLHVSKANVSAWETGKHEPSYAQMVEIARAAKFTVPLPGMATPAWPFREVTPEQFALLSERELGKVEERILTLIETKARKSPDEEAA